MLSVIQEHHRTEFTAKSIPNSKQEAQISFGLAWHLFWDNVILATNPIS